MKLLHDEPTAVLDRLLEVVVLLGEDMTQSLAREGLTVPRAHLLWLLQHHGPTTQRALADSLRVTPRNVTGLVDGLVAGGHVTREPHPGDRRAALVSLTPSGASTLAEMDRGHRDLAGLLFEAMSGLQLGAFADGLGRAGPPARGAGPVMVAWSNGPGVSYVGWRPSRSASGAASSSG